MCVFRCFLLCATCALLVYTIQVVYKSCTSRASRHLPRTRLDSMHSVWPPSCRQVESAADEEEAESDDASDEDVLDADDGEDGDTTVGLDEEANESAGLTGGRKGGGTRNNSKRDGNKSGKARGKGAKAASEGMRAASPDDAQGGGGAAARGQVMVKAFIEVAGEVHTIYVSLAQASAGSERHPLCERRGHNAHHMHSP